MPAPPTLTYPASTGQVGVAYSSALVAAGGVPPYRYSITSGSLPTGLTLNPSTGAITGTPTAYGTFTLYGPGCGFQRHGSRHDVDQLHHRNFPPILVLTCPTSTGQVGVAYSSALVASGGVPPYTYSIITGSLPTGLTPNPSTGAITGTPSAAGTFTFTAQVVDSRGNAAGTTTANCSITIEAPSLTITKVADTGGTQSTVAAAGQPIGFTVTVTSGAPAVATNITLTDPLPNTDGASSGGVSWSIDATSGGPTCSISGTVPNQTLNCSEATLAVGASFSMHVTSATTSTSAGLYSNCATASATDVSPVQACALITVIGACSLNYPFGKAPALTSVVFNESTDLVAAAACNTSGCGESVAGPSDWVALWYTDEHAQTLGVRQVAVKTSSGATTTNYPITALSTNPGTAMNPQVGNTMLGDNQYFYLDSSRPLWPALFPTDITNDPTATSDGMRRPVSGRDAVYAPKLSTCSRHR